MGTEIFGKQKFVKGIFCEKMDYLRSDCILREILEERKSLTGFLDAVFGFMSRNTDFYHIQTTKDDKLGFPRGVKEQILISCMQKYERKLDQPKLMPEQQAVEPPAFVAEQVEVETEERSTDAECHPNQENINTSDTAELLDTSSGNNSAANIPKFSESEYKNGSVFDNYCWCQNLGDIELCVFLPAEVKLAKHVRVDLKPNFITIKTLLPKEQTLINAETWDKYKHTDVIWSISERKLVVSLDKVKECWWDKLFLNETAIDTQHVSSERSFSDYSPDVKNAIEKLHMQKLQQNQAEQMALLNESEPMARLRQAWNSEGSPFKGKPFDPSIIQFN